jgi:hypothetical protein
MKRVTLVLMSIIVMFTTNPLAAQTAGSGTTSKDRSGAASIIFKGINWINSPESAIHPVINVVPTGGLGLGLEYDSPKRDRWHTTAKGIVTTRRYWSAELSAGYSGDFARVEAYGRARDLSQLSFFGRGMDSEVADRTNFRLRDPVIGGIAWLHAGPWLAIGGRVEEIWPDVSPGRSSAEPSIEELFDDEAAPGLTAQPRFGRYEALAKIDVPPAAGEALQQGATYRMAYAIFHDQQFDRFTFRRFDVEAQQRLAVFRPHHRLTVHGWMSTTDTATGHRVPFYFQRTLGGRGHLRSVHDDVIGSDGTEAALRGFRSLRFRDAHLLLLQAEYRVPLWGPLDATVFTEAGKVTSRRKDLNLSDLKHSHGFSLSVMRGRAAAARVDFGFGGGEGTRVLVSVGTDFVP